MTRLEGHIDKGWGYEYIWASTDKYCGKLLTFKEDAEFSMHFHSHKEESWYVLDGKFILKYIDTRDAKVTQISLSKGDTWHNMPLMPHQLKCVEAGTILEVSTPDSVEDNYRVMPGDSQRAKLRREQEIEENTNKWNF
jgi:mannose-6-phosphate isomerase